MTEIDNLIFSLFAFEQLLLMRMRIIKEGGGEGSGARKKEGIVIVDMYASLKCYSMLADFVLKGGNADLDFDQRRGETREERSEERHLREYEEVTTDE